VLSDAGSTPAASTTSRLARGGFGAVVRQAAPPFGLANVLDSRRLQIPHFVRSLSAARLGFARRISFVALGTTPGVPHFSVEFPRILARVLVTFAVLGAINWIPRWYDPAGKATSDEIAQAFGDYLVAGLVGTETIDLARSDSRSRAELHRLSS